MVQFFGRPFLGLALALSDSLVQSRKLCRELGSFVLKTLRSGRICLGTSGESCPRGRRLDRIGNRGQVLVRAVGLCLCLCLKIGLGLWLWLRLGGRELGAVPFEAESEERTLLLELQGLLLVESDGNFL